MVGLALVVVAIVWLAVSCWLVERGVRQQGFATYLDSGNVSGALIGLVLPGAVLAVLHHRASVKVQTRLHQQTRDHNERLHAETRAHAERLNGGQQ